MFPINREASPQKNPPFLGSAAGRIGNVSPAGSGAYCTCRRGAARCCACARGCAHSQSCIDCWCMEDDERLTLWCSHHGHVFFERLCDVRVRRWFLKLGHVQHFVKLYRFFLASDESELAWTQSSHFRVQWRAVGDGTFRGGVLLSFLLTVAGDSSCVREFWPPHIPK